ncbi:PAS domain-containing protein [Trichothermofontia sp.]
MPDSHLEDRLSKLLQHMPGVVYELRQHPNGHFSLPYANDNLAVIYGLSPKEVAVDAQPWFRAIHPEDRPGVWQSLQASAQSLSTWHSTHRVCHADGHCLWVATHATPERQPDGGTCWYGHLHNVTPFRQTQQRSETKLQRIIETLNEMVFIAAPDGTFTFLSPMFERVMGYPRQELLHAPFAPLVHSTERPTVVAAFHAVLTGERVQHVEYRVRHADGRYYWHAANLSPFEEDNGRIACLGASSLIDDRKQAEAALQESQLRLQLALESSNIGLWDWYLQTNEVVFNTHWWTMLGYGEGEIGNHVSDWESRVYPQDLPAAYDDVHRHLSGETDYYRNEHRLRCKDGSYKWILAQGRVVEWDEQGNPVRFIGTYVDISDRKQAELQLIELSTQLGKAQEVAKLGHWSFDLATQKITWSKEIFRIFNRSLELGEPSLEEYIDLVHPDDRAELLKQVSAAHQGIPQNLDYRILLPDGTIRYLSSRIELEIENEQVTRLFGVVMDITERRVAELELERFFTISLDLLCIADTSGHFRRLSQAWSDVLGYPLAELEGQVFLTFVHPDDVPATLAALSSAKQGRAVTKFTNRYRTQSGSYRHLEWFALPQGELVYAAARDITERIETQAQLESLLNRAQLLNMLSNEIRQSLELDQIIETAIEAIFYQLNLDVCTFGKYWQEEDRCYVEIFREKRKPSCRSWLGVYDATHYPNYHQALLNNQVFTFNRQNPEGNYDPGIYEFCESMGINLYLLLPIHTSGKICSLEMGRTDGSIDWQPDEIELLQRLGTQIAIAMQQAALYQTAQQRSEELQAAYRDLQEAQVKLIQAEKMSSLGQLVAGIAHEINNPISFIYGNLQPLSQYLEDLMNMIKAYQEAYPQPPLELKEIAERLDLSFIANDSAKILNSMRNGAIRIRDIVKSLRTFSRLDEADLKPADINENIDISLVLLENNLNGRDGSPAIKVIRNYGDLTKFECYIGLLNQVFMNLLMNAIQAIEEKQKVQGEDYQGIITITTSQTEQAIILSVQDNGIGMSDEVKRKIFEPFFTTKFTNKFTTKSVGYGTGMGLSISYQIVTQNHHGEFHIDSQLGEGSTFTIRLPRLPLR